MNIKILGACISFSIAAVMSGCVATPPVQRGGPPVPVPSKGGTTVAVQTTPTCSPPEVHVTLNQVNITGSTATVKVNPGQKLVPLKGAGIRWNFSGNAYSFTVDGITFSKTGYPSQPYGPIDYGPGNNPTEYVVCFGDTTTVGAATWYYNIKFIENDRPSIVWTCDPTLVNSQSEAGAEQTVSCVSTTLVQ